MSEPTSGLPTVDGLMALVRQLTDEVKQQERAGITDSNRTIELWQAIRAYAASLMRSA